MPPVSESLPKPVAAPERSLLQRMEALQRANDIRSRRAQLKRDLKAGRQPIHELLLEPPEYLETAKVFDLLLAVPKYGRVKVNKILSQCRISPSKTIGGLSERQRRVRAGVPLVLESEVQGARQVREAMPEAVTVFIAPPSQEALRARLVGRGTDSADQVDERLRTALRELEARSEFGHVVVNDRLEKATDELAEIVRTALGGSGAR